MYQKTNKLTNLKLQNFKSNKCKISPKYSRKRKTWIPLKLVKPWN